MMSLIELAERVEMLAVEQTEALVACETWEEADGFARLSTNLWQIAAALRSRAALVEEE